MIIEYAPQPTSPARFAIGHGTMVALNLCAGQLYAVEHHLLQMVSMITLHQLGNEGPVALGEFWS